MSEDREATVEQVWQDYWVGTVFEGREPTLEEIKRELSDFHMVMSEVGKVYYHVTGGQISKITTHAHHVTSAADEHYEELHRELNCDESCEYRQRLPEVKAERDQLQADLEALRETDAEIHDDSIEKSKDIRQLRSLVEQLSIDLNEAHDQLMYAQGETDPSQLDWPEWSSPANSIRWAERLLGKRLAKTNAWSEHPDAVSEEREQ